MLYLEPLASSLTWQASDQRAGVKFLTHNVRDEFDDVTEIARLYRIKTVPCFGFFAGGAMVRDAGMPKHLLEHLFSV